MTSLPKEQRKQLERVVLSAREEAERGSAAAVEAYGVGDARRPSHLDKAGEDLRKKLRAHGRQVGDVRRPDDSQEVKRLIHECGYVHWHRMLFARFLAENGFLIEPGSGLDVDLDFCEERARETKNDKWEVAAGFAQRMLPGIFRPDDPVLQLRLPVETRNRLTALLASLPRDVFLADDSLGWVYQFWQAKKKDEVNASGEKIGADELAAVTQLFTEDYMVEFLLHNTLGAWWTAKRRAEGKSQPIVFAYLRLKADGAAVAGPFEDWPKTVKELRVLDPCMGSGHFLVAELPILVGMRQEEEKLSVEEAVLAVLRDNLFGLELDPRCAQIAAFNLALAAWKLIGRTVSLPQLNLACSGLGIAASREEWLALLEQTRAASNLRFFFGQLYDMFRKAPLLGSLINPARFLGSGMLNGSDMNELREALNLALMRADLTRPDTYELEIQAQGLSRAAQFLGGRYHLVTTNVPYLARGKQDPSLQEFIDSYYPNGKFDLATAFVLRCLEFCEAGGTTLLVTPQNWLFLRSYRKLREHLLRRIRWDLVARIGEHGFDSTAAAGAFTAMFVLTRQEPAIAHQFVGIDVAEERSPTKKAEALLRKAVTILQQAAQLDKPDARISVEDHSDEPPLSEYCSSFVGLGTGDYPHYGRCFWEFPILLDGWVFQQATVETPRLWGGREHVLAWDKAIGRVRGMSNAEREQIHNQDQSGQQAWGKRGIAVGLMRELKPTLFSGEVYEKALSALIPHSEEHLAAIWAFCSSADFNKAVRKLDHNIIVANATLVKVPFDLPHWQTVAAAKYPHGLPKPFSSDPTQWLFNGHPKDSDHPLQVAVARLIGYAWPRQTGSSFPDCPAIGVDGLEKHSDKDGMACFSQVRDEAPAATRLRALLTDAYGVAWNYALERKLIADTGSKADSLEDWLLNDFFAQHCITFHGRPFVWHIWDGRKDGFNVLVNYHKLAGQNGEAHRTLETLAYAYLGDWINRQRNAVGHGEGGAEDRLVVALELQNELKNILVGEPPYDLFIRWKTLAHQPVGWTPDLSDGVRMNIRPFMLANLSSGKAGAGVLRVVPKGVKWTKDRGADPLSRSKEEFPWFWSWDSTTMDWPGGMEFTGERWNDCHYSTQFKLNARMKMKL